MQLLVIRHAKAQEHGLPGGDFNRTLVEKGIQQSQEIAHFLQKHDLLPEIILTSPYRRSKETAETIANAAELDSPVIEDWLSCGMHPEDALEQLATYSEFDRVAMVGHEPDLSMFINHCIGASYPGVDVKKASVALLEINPPHVNAILRFHVPPKILGV